jgi:hypothetical protein
VPKATHAANFLQALRRKDNGPVTATLNDVKNWCDERKAIPDDEDTPFVFQYEISAMPEQKFRIFITTKRLVDFTKYVSILSFYYYYKLITN